MWHNQRLCNTADQHLFQIFTASRVCEDFYPSASYTKLAGKVHAYKDVRFKKEYGGKGHDPTYVEKK